MCREYSICKTEEFVRAVLLLQMVATEDMDIANNFYLKYIYIYSFSIFSYIFRKRFFSAFEKKGNDGTDLKKNKLGGRKRAKENRTKQLHTR